MTVTAYFVGGSLDLTKRALVVAAPSYYSAVLEQAEFRMRFDEQMIVRAPVEEYRIAARLDRDVFIYQYEGRQS